MKTRWACPSRRARHVLAAAEVAGALSGPNGFDLGKSALARIRRADELDHAGQRFQRHPEIVALALLEPGTSAVYAQHSFAVYRLATQARGAHGAGQDYGHDLDAMFDAIADDTRVVFIAKRTIPPARYVPGEQSLLSWSADAGRAWRP